MTEENRSHSHGVVLETKDLLKQFASVKAINYLSIAIPKQGITSIIGPNGSGKSTLINVLSGTLPIDDGLVIIDGISMKAILPYHSPSHGVTRTFQEVRLFNQMTVWDNILVILTKREVLKSLFEPTRPVYRRRAQELLEAVGLWEKRRDQAETLSYGQRKLLEVGRALAMNVAQPAAAAQCLFVAFAFACLVQAFVVDDFSVTYVALNSNSAMPWYYKVSAVWGGHEGSLLLWALILAGWTFAVAIFSRDLPEEMLAAHGAQFYHVDRGGDITFHGPGQLVGYPLLDLDRFFTDIHRYLRVLEAILIDTCADYGVQAGRVAGRTGVWIGPDATGPERKICALGIRCSRWVTMHGFAFNLNTDLSFFDHIIPCGITDRGVTSLVREHGRPVDEADVRVRLIRHFAEAFGAQTTYLEHDAAFAYLEDLLGVHELPVLKYARFDLS
ncbi:MAG: lipoyl(octanoyl) transferase LipB [Bacteroidetes bacterium]|nr:lipoyl(octanoyl) transferase LipB [Bacteroidota bacterium]